MNVLDGVLLALAAFGFTLGGLFVWEAFRDTDTKLLLAGLLNYIAAGLLVGAVL